MANITRDTIIHLAELSRLQLTDKEIESLSADIATIVNYVDQLSTLDTSNVEPTYQVIDLENVWRDDAVVDSGVSRDGLLALAAETADNQVKVPKVL